MDVGAGSLLEALIGVGALAAFCTFFCLSSNILAFGIGTYPSSLIVVLSLDGWCWVFSDAAGAVGAAAGAGVGAAGAGAGVSTTGVAAGAGAGVSTTGVAIGAGAAAGSGAGAAVSAAAGASGEANVFGKIPCINSPVEGFVYSP